MHMTDELPLSCSDTAGVVAENTPLASPFCNWIISVPDTVGLTELTEAEIRMDVYTRTSDNKAPSSRHSGRSEAARTSSFSRPSQWFEAIRTSSR